MTTEELRRKAIERLNFRQSQHPADIYYIKRNKEVLQSYLADEERSRRIVERATPRYAKRFHLFGVKQSDYEHLLTKDVYVRQMSPKDPFISLPSRNNKPEQYQSVSKGV